MNAFASPRFQEETATLPTAAPASHKSQHIGIGKSFTVLEMAGKTMNLDVFTMTVKGETIELLPLRNWSQLDHYKWTARGILPAAPAGLEIALDHVRVTGQTVSINDPAGCAKLERIFDDWLLAEQENLDPARKKTKVHWLFAVEEPHAPAEAQSARFRVEVDKRGQVHVSCVQGKETLAVIGLTVAGFNSLCQQGLMRKPRVLRTGVLHDWVELDGHLCSFEKDRNDAARLEQLLNESYLPLTTIGFGNEIIVFANAASSTGFDIQFPILMGGVPHNQKQHLNEESLELLRDANRCGLLHKDIIIKLVSPNLVFKQKTPEGGEKYLAANSQSTIRLTDDDGNIRALDLSQPLNLLRLNAAELTAVFNHPLINQHAKAAPVSALAGEGARKADRPAAVPEKQSKPAAAMSAPLELRVLPAAQPETAPTPQPRPETPAVESVPKEQEDRLILKKTEAPKTLPNLWLKEILSRPSLSPNWFACLAYSKIAERFGNSTEGKFGPARCWFIHLSDAEEIDHPAFKGIFLTEKGSLGFLSAERMARFYNGVAFLGTQQWALEGVQVDLLAVGLDCRERVVFILSDNFRATFGVSAATLTELLERLSECGVVIMSVADVLASCEPIEVAWTVPAEQANAEDPQALESLRPQ